MKLNDMQRAVLRDYDNGEFAYLSQQDSILETDIQGDGLLEFILAELSSKEGCESLEDGVSRITQARDDLDVCLIALQHLQQELDARSEDTQHGN